MIEPVSLVTMIQYGMPVMMLAMIIFMVALYYRVGNLVEILREIKDGMVWRDTCTERHKEIDRRLAEIERQRQGGH